MKKETIILDKTDIAIVVRRTGTAEAYIPMEEDVSWQSIHSMLREIRKLEKVFTELTNKTYKGGKNE